MLLKLLGEVTPLVFKNNLRIILDSTSEKFKNIEALQIVRYTFFYKKKVYKKMRLKWPKS